ncbi:MAG: DUF4843 domain-containing protein, partial [Candidatus Cryptobacteroides sp.]
LYIQQDDFIDGDPVDLANLTKSFALYPGETEMEVSYTVKLIGVVMDYDRPYEIVVDDPVVDTLKVTMTDGTVKKYRLYPAEPSEYEIISPVLKANETSSSLVVKLKKTARMDTDTVRLSFHLVPCENFDLGYEDRLRGRVTFGNFPVKPSWWTLYIETVYFGAYSAEKYKAFYDCFHITELDEEISATELREMALTLKEYIRENGLTEADGSPMELPII